MFDFDENDSENVVIPTVDFTSEIPIIKGKFSVGFHTWKGLITQSGTDLTWKKLIKILDKHNDGSHIFLEVVDVIGDKAFVFLGS